MTLFNQLTSKQKAIFASEQPVAVAFPVSHPVGIAVIRSLGENGVPVLGIDFKPRSAGHYSRYCTPFFHPDIYKDEETFFNFLLELGKQFKTKPVLFLLDDPDLIMSLKRREALEAYYRLPLAGWPIIEPIMDKGKLYRLCQENNYPIPETWWATSVDELDKIKSQIRYPCIIKPTFSDEFRNVFGIKARRSDNYEDLRSFFIETQKHGIEVVVQEEILGEGDQLYTYGAYCNQSQDPVSVFLGRKLYQFPPDFGTARMAESLQDEELDHLGKWLVELTGFYGICLTEFKRDSQGQLRLIELNPRPGGWVEHLGSYCGANFVLAAYLDTIGEAVVPSRNTDSGVKWVNFLEHMYYCLRGYGVYGYPNSGTSFMTWWRSLKNVRVESFFSWRDPMPSIVRTLSLVGEIYRSEKQLKRAGTFRLP